jgi:hypothetical protein
MIGDLLNQLGGGNDERAMQIQQQMLREAQSIPLPILKEFYPELYQVVAQMNPELETAVNLGPSAMAGISTDPKLRQAQMNALSKLESIGLGEQSAEDQARMANITNDVNTNLQGQQGAIMQNLAQRGMSGGGTELAQRMMASQGAANRQASMAMDAKAQAERRALDAIMQSGQLGGQMQSQDFQQQQSKAQAADAISRFNAQNQQNVIGSNVGAKNQAQMYNAGQQNQAGQMNTEARNQATQRNLSLAQQDYENKLKKLGIVSNAQAGMADTYRNQANQNRQFVGGLIGAGAQAYGAYQGAKGPLKTGGK